MERECGEKGKEWQAPNETEKKEREEMKVKKKKKKNRTWKKPKAEGRLFLGERGARTTERGFSPG